MPQKEATRRGRMEKAVKPLTHKATIFRKVNVVVPACRSRCSMGTFTMCFVVHRSNPVR